METPGEGVFVWAKLDLDKLVQTGILEPARAKAADTPDFDTSLKIG